MFLYVNANLTPSLELGVIIKGNINVNDVNIFVYAYLLDVLFCNEGH